MHRASTSPATILTGLGARDTHLERNGNPSKEACVSQEMKWNPRSAGIRRGEGYIQREIEKAQRSQVPRARKIDALLVRKDCTHMLREWKVRKRFTKPEGSSTGVLQYGGRGCVVCIHQNETNLGAGVEVT